MMTDITQENFDAMCEMHWAQVLEMVEETAPEDLEVIEAHKEICLKVFKQGVHAGWNAGVSAFVAQLKSDGLVTEHKAQ